MLAAFQHIVDSTTPLMLFALCCKLPVLLCRAASQEVLQKAEELKNLGNHAFFSRDLPKAVAYYSQALHLNPTSPMLHTNRSFTHVPYSCVFTKLLDRLQQYKAVVSLINNAQHCPAIAAVCAVSFTLPPSLQSGPWIVWYLCARHHLHLVLTFPMRNDAASSVCLPC